MFVEVMLRYLNTADLLERVHRCQRRCESRVDALDLILVST